MANLVKLVRLFSVGILFFALFKTAYAQNASFIGLSINPSTVRIGDRVKIDIIEAPLPLPDSQFVGLYATGSAREIKSVNAKVCFGNGGNTCVFQIPTDAGISTATYEFRLYTPAASSKTVIATSKSFKILDATTLSSPASSDGPLRLVVDKTTAKKGEKLQVELEGGGQSYQLPANTKLGFFPATYPQSKIPTLSETDPINANDCFSTNRLCTYTIPQSANLSSYVVAVFTPSDVLPTMAKTYLAYSNPFSLATFPDSVAASCKTLLSQLMVSFGAVCGDNNYNRHVDVASSQNSSEDFFGPDGAIDIFDFNSISQHATNATWCQQRLDDQASFCDSQTEIPPPTPPNSCNSNADCKNNQVCSPTACPDQFCPSGQSCSSCISQCVDRQPTCKTDKDCSPNQMCNQICPLKCPLGSSCDVSCSGFCIAKETTPTPSTPTPLYCNFKTDCPNGFICAAGGPCQSGTPNCNGGTRICIAAPSPSPISCQSNSDCPAGNSCHIVPLGILCAQGRTCPPNPGMCIPNEPTPPAITIFPPLPQPSRDTPGAVRNQTWLLRNSTTAGNADITFQYEMQPGDIPVVGDWNGDGIKTPGVFRNGTWLLKNSNSSGPSDITFQFGQPGDTPIVGDWTGKVSDSVGVVRGNTWFLKNTNSDGVADISFTYGILGDKPVVGDWDGNGTDTPGVVRNSNWWFLKNSLPNDIDPASGNADIVFFYGIPGDIPVVGDFDGNKTDTPGVVRDNIWYLKNSNTTGFADVVFAYGLPGDVPVVGKWQTPPTIISTIPSLSISPPTSYTISGTVFIDKNQNGVRDESEEGYQDATVSNGSTTVQTDNQGHFSFSNLSQKQYIVALSVPQQYVLTTGNPVSPLLFTQNTTVNFGIVPQNAIVSPTSTPCVTSAPSPTFFYNIGGIPSPPIPCTTPIVTNKFSCLPPNRKLTDIVSAQINGNKTTIAQKLQELQAYCDPQNVLRDSSKKEIRFFDLLGCWGNPPFNYQELLQQWQDQLNALRQQYDVIVVGYCDPRIVQGLKY